MAPEENKKFWFKTWWGILIIITFLPFVAVWWVWKKSNWNRNLKLGIIVAIFLLMFIAGLSTLTTSNSQKSVETPKERSENIQPQSKIEETVITPTPEVDSRSWAVKLAMLQTGDPNPSKTVIDAFDNLLIDLDSKCTENDKRKISDYIVFSRDKLKEKGVKLSLLEVAKGINDSIPQGAKDEKVISCAEVATAFVLSISKR